MANKLKTLTVPASNLFLQTQAVSDGELNMSRPSETGSSPTLNSDTTGGKLHSRIDGPASRVVSWAVCFEHLMEDPVGVRYFTAFLKSEVSAENILFWQACEKFQKIAPTNLSELKKHASSIYNQYISENSVSPVNIDDTARTNESDLEKPTPEMFGKAQEQIYKLMKFDSYTRFVRSPLYQNCMLASVEGRPLPDLEPQNKCVTPTSDRKNTSVKTPSSDGKANKRKKIEKRGSWGDVSYRQITVIRQQSQISVKSSSSVELGLLSNRSEDGCSSPVASELNLSVRADKYCCVFMPDGTASLVPARAGLTLRDILSSLCEKRGFPMKDVVIYLQGKDKNTCQRQQPLSLNQDSSVLQDQQVSLEVRITFTLEMVFTGKAIGIKAKSSKTLGDAVFSVLQKHQLRPQDVIITLRDSKDPLNMDSTVLCLANKTLCLDRIKNGSDGKGSPAVDRGRTSTKPKHEMDGITTKEREHIALVQRSPTKDQLHVKQRSGIYGSQARCGSFDDCNWLSDKSGLVEMLTRIQCSRANDQRGLLTKEQLELPSFLQIPTQPGKGTEEDQSPDEGQGSSSNKHSIANENTVLVGELCVTGNHKDTNGEKNKMEQSDCAGSAMETSH